MASFAYLHSILCKTGPPKTQGHRGHRAEGEPWWFCLPGILFNRACMPRSQHTSYRAWEMPPVHVITVSLVGKGSRGEVSEAWIHGVVQSQRGCPQRVPVCWVVQRNANVLRPRNGPSLLCILHCTCVLTCWEHPPLTASHPYMLTHQAWPQSLAHGSNPTA